MNINILKFYRNFFRSYLPLAQHGGVYAIPDETARSSLALAWTGVLRVVDRVQAETVHLQDHSGSSQFSGQFSLDTEEAAQLRVTLTVQDEEKVNKEITRDNRSNFTLSVSG